MKKQYFFSLFLFFLVTIVVLVVSEVQAETLVTCGITINNPLTFGGVEKAQKSSARILNITNTGTQDVSLQVNATNWIDKETETVNVIDAKSTRFSFSLVPYGQQTSLNDTTGEFVDFAEIPAGVTNSSYWRAKAQLNDPLFLGDIFQEMTFEATCL